MTGLRATIGCLSWLGLKAETVNGRINFLSGCEALAGCRDAILTGVFGFGRDGGTPKTHLVPSGVLESVTGWR